MPRRQEIIEEIADTEELEARLVELSVELGGAWSFWIEPFSHTTHFIGAKNRSALGSSLYYESRNRIGWKGEIWSFTKGQIIEETKPTMFGR